MAIVTWAIGARPKTLIASISPVLIGASLALEKGPISWALFVLLLLFGVSTQIGTNFSNDYYDYIQGADTKKRIGPKRLTQVDNIAPHAILFAAFLMFTFSFLVSIAIASFIGFFAIGIGAVSILFGILYTAGRYSLAYNGLGEAFVLLFFGIIATCTTEFALSGTFSLVGLIASMGPGLLSTAIIVVNNLRDIEEDTQAKKKTLAVRFGALFAQFEYIICISTAALIPVACFALLPEKKGILLASGIILPSIPLVSTLLSYKDPSELNKLLGQTGILLFLYTFLFVIGIIV